MVKVGDWIRIKNEDGQYTKWAKKKWQVNHVARSVFEHRGYDTGMGGEALVSCRGLPVSLYEYEFDVVG